MLLYYAMDSAFRPTTACKTVTGRTNAIIPLLLGRIVVQYTQKQIDESMDNHSNRVEKLFESIMGCLGVTQLRCESFGPRQCGDLNAFR